MGKTVIRWDGTHLPEEFKAIPPGTYTLVGLPEAAPLTPEEEEGIEEAIRQLDAGQGIPLEQVIARIRRRHPGA